MKIQAGSVIIAVMLTTPVGIAGAGEPAGTTASGTPSRQSRFTEPAIATQPPITWPGDQDRDALVYVRTTISAQGKVTAAEVDEGGFHELRFAEEAVNAVRRMSFKPAQYDGTPVVTTVVIPIKYYGSFRTEDGKVREHNEISPAIRDDVFKIQELYKSGSTEEANIRAEKLIRQKVRYRYEYYVLRALMAENNLRAGRERDALQAAFDATRSTTPNFAKFQLHQPDSPDNGVSYYFLSRDIVLPLLESRMRIASKLGQYVTALEAWYELTRFGAVPAGDTRAAIARQITAKLEGRDPLTASILMRGSRMSWQLFRPNFKFTDVQGTVEALQLYCGKEFQKLTYAPNAEWRAPGEATDCTLEIWAKAGTSFKLAERAD